MKTICSDLLKRHWKIVYFTQQKIPCNFYLNNYCINIVHTIINTKIKETNGTVGK